MKQNKPFVGNWKRYRMKSSWYRPDPISKLRAGAVDVSWMHDTYKNWLKCRDIIAVKGIAYIMGHPNGLQQVARVYFEADVVAWEAQQQQQQQQEERRAAS